MSAPGSNDYERLQQDVLRMRTSSPAERREFLRQRRNTPVNARRALMLAGAVYLLGGIGQTVKAVQEDKSALIIGVLVAATALSVLMIELGRRGRTRLGFTVFVVGFIVLSFFGML
ncbi:hypothetical protein ACQEU8_34270 [Streptomyces sp. CA-250714]|uniref:hypothetical protein n=1 Tax=Streptomyces sp. CA-250714 TaxID=3240060 RepID=UPI003D92F768